MRKKLLPGLTSLVMLAGMLATALPAGAGPPLPDYRPVDVGPELRAWEPTLDLIAGPIPDEVMAGSGDGGSVSASAVVGDVKVWLGLDNYCGYYYAKPYELRGIGTYGELWVAVDLGWTTPPAICMNKTSDPRSVPVITDEQVDYMLDQFDNVIYPVEGEFFTTPDPHDGTEAVLGGPGYYEGDKVVILVDNVRDANWYDPTYPLYIAGFYSPSFEYYFDRNVMSIDAYDWENRTGPDAARPYLYEGVFAHEYQHLLHDDADPGEENFINEGMAMLAEYLTGYAVGEEQYGAFLERPENSLVVWGDQGGLEILSDYSNTYLFQFFLMEQYGESFIQDLFHNPETGISGVNSTLDDYPGRRKDFGDIYHDFSIAVLIDARTRNYRYGFEELDVNIDIGTLGAPNPEAYNTPGAPPWGTDYIWIDGENVDGPVLLFDGEDREAAHPTLWTSDGNVLWGGIGNLIDHWAIFEAYVDSADPTLSFDTYWDIEDYWDFGFVQVSTDGGETWTSLRDVEGYATYSHYSSAHPDIIANLPGLTSWSCYLAADPCWINLSYDLSAYADQSILLAFRYMTDWNTFYEGWYIDNVYVGSDLISDGSDASVFKDITEVAPKDFDFTVTFVGIEGSDYRVITMKLDDLAGQGRRDLEDMLDDFDNVVMLVTFDAPEGYTEYADYEYSFVEADD